MGESPASFLAMFFCSMSLTTLGGNVLIRMPFSIRSPVAKSEEDVDNVLRGDVEFADSAGELRSLDEMDINRGLSFSTMDHDF